MTHRQARHPLVNLEAVRTHFHQACRTRHPVDLWRSAADIPVLLAELSRSRSLLALNRMKHANLVAASRATLIAAQDGEEDPLYYLVDELATQDQVPPIDSPVPEPLEGHNDDPADGEED
jgi:hypothetical protein